MAGLALNQLVVVLDADLNSLGNNSWAYGTIEISNTDLWPSGDRKSVGSLLYADFEAYVNFASAPTAARLSLYVLPCYDGVNYVDGRVGVNPSSNLMLGSFALTTQVSQRLALPGIQLPVCVKMKFALYNDGAVSALTSAGNTVKMSPYLWV